MSKIAKGHNSIKSLQNLSKSELESGNLSQIPNQYTKYQDPS